ncbi:MAG: D-alanyl-D-alanine carboxypeptidase family protein [Nitrospiraceae bacterium]
MILLRVSALIWLSGILLSQGLISGPSQAVAETASTTSTLTAPSSDARATRIAFRRPNSRADSILLKDLVSGKTLYQYKADRRLSPASLTKIMSALIILDYGHLDEPVTVSRYAASAPKIRLKLRAGEVWRLNSLLKAMLMASANDACRAAVQHVAGSEARFVELMNTKARALGLPDTRFRNACGFDARGHYSTALDLARLSEVAMQHSTFRSLVGREFDIITALNADRSHLLRNTNQLLGRIPGVEGVKTGFTSRAGRCLVAKVSQEGKELLLVLLNAKRRWSTARLLINYGLDLVEDSPR